MHLRRWRTYALTCCAITDSGSVFSCGFGATLGVGDLQTRNKFTWIESLDRETGINSGTVVKVSRPRAC